MERIQIHAFPFLHKVRVFGPAVSSTFLRLGCRLAQLLIILVLGEDPHCGSPGPAGLPLVLGRDLELVVGVVAERVQPPVVGDETIRVDSKAVIRDMIGNVGITAAVCITRLHSQDGGSDGDVLVNVVSLIFCSIRWLYTM